MASRSTTFRVPPALLNLKGLGEPRQYFPRRELPSDLLQIATWGVFLLSASLFGYAGLTAYQKWRHFGVAASRGTILWLTLAGILLLASGIGLWVMRRHRSGRGVMVYQAGLAMEAPGGPRRWRWDAWVNLTVDNQTRKFLGTVRKKQFRYLLVDDRGEVLVLDERLEGIQDLGVLLEQNILPHLLEAAEQKYRAGEVLQFGPLQIQREAGITFGQQQVPWAALNLLAVKAGYLEIQLKRAGKHDFRFPTARLPNLAVLLALSAGHPGVRVQV